MRITAREIPEDLWSVLAGARFLFATWVLFAHTANFGTAARAMPVPSSNALVAVYCFLAISGFSIHHSIAVKPQNYVGRRIGRIAPSHLASIALAVLAYVICGPVLYDGFGNPWQLPSLGRWVACALLLQALIPVAIPILFPSWSLSIEVICYAFAPYLIRKEALFAVTILIASCAICFMRPQFSHLYIGSDSYGLSFASMVWAWIAGWLAYSERCRGLRIYAASALVGVFAIGTDPLLSGWFNYFCWVATLTLLWFGRVRINSKIQKFALYAGDLSYPLYVIHYPVLFIIYNAVLRSHPELNWGFTQIFAVVIASAVVLEFIDKPCRKLVVSQLTRAGIAHQSS